ncbi:Tetracycline transcriptional regulator, TetR-like, C-terminal [Syntrophomonas zehnderi OL-4]|uniref:Tetracycline transcriptional regulator, TetR-like, C-terminal n=1 Tax=Syntrophomonas zehnderi OL-4 TaxID=690567 RepID=A0A0E4GCG7_9FIRM|nr:TetR/AcrR family transcriptional regulator [Syntrophomonas zehnderi]CFX14125.1 Tetracycline transcriptional regulator, TetR-like, C-terminal [Syntrophomonas zehnderi OL-4]
MGNRRSQITKRILRDCLLEMLQEKPFSKISVRELCYRADINRSTFYIHYKDLYDLFDSLEQETLNQLTQYMEQRVQRDRQEDAMTDLLTYFRDNSSLYLTLLQTSLTYTDRIIETVFQVYRQYYQDIGKELTEEDAYYIEFNIAGTVKLIKKWLLNDGQRSPREMAVMLFSFGDRE